MYWQGANSMSASGLGCRKALVGAGWWPISVLFGINGLGNKLSHLVGPPFPALRAHFSATMGRHLPGALTECWLSGGCGWSHVSA